MFDVLFFVRFISFVGVDICVFLRLLKFVFSMVLVLEVFEKMFWVLRFFMLLIFVDLVGVFF